MMRNYFFFLLASISVVAVEAADSLPFGVATVERESVARERTLNGKVDAVNQTTVSAQTSGEVVEVLYDVDDYVKQGQVILRIRATRQKAGLKQATANREEAKARLTQAAQEFERIEGIYDRKLVAKSKLDKAKAELDAATARYSAAMATVTTAKDQAKQTLVRAPYSGIVTARQVELGEFVNVGQKLMTGVSLEKLRINVDVPQRLINKVRKLKKARLILDDPEESAIPVESLTFFPFADSMTNTFKVRVNLDGDVEGLFPGMFVKVAFTIGEKEQLVVPKSAVAFRGEVTGAYILDQNNRPRLRQVRLGHAAGPDKLVVLSGLQEGEKVALDPIAAGIYLKRIGQAETSTGDPHE